MNLSKKKLRDLRDLSGEIVLASNGNGNGPPVSPWPLHLPTFTHETQQLGCFWQLGCVSWVNVTDGGNRRTVTRQSAETAQLLKEVPKLGLLLLR